MTGDSISGLSAATATYPLKVLEILLQSDFLSFPIPLFGDY